TALIHHSFTSHLNATLCCNLSLYASFLYNTPSTTEIYTLSLHDALPICEARAVDPRGTATKAFKAKLLKKNSQLNIAGHERILLDRKSTRLNSSHQIISYAVFCLKKKKKKKTKKIQCDYIVSNQVTYIRQ